MSSDDPSRPRTAPANEDTAGSVGGSDGSVPSAPDAASVSPPAEQDSSSGPASRPEVVDPVVQRDEAVAESARLREQLVRLAADFDNYRKRARRDVEEAERRVQESLVRSLLPTFDNLERALTHAETAQDIASLTEGIQMVVRQLHDTLTGLGIDRVPSVGAAFDPGVHEAVQQVEDPQVPAGSVASELQAGYLWKGRLVRPAMVVVSKGPAVGAEEA